MTTTQQLRVGFVGVGTISAAIVEGLLTGPRASRYELVLSPRSADRVGELRSRFPQLQVAADNQGVLNASDVVVLAVLPQQLEAVCAALRFREDHVVASLAARWPADRVAPVVAPAHRIAQVVPLPIVRLHTGPIVMYPDVPALHDLFADLGEVIVPTSAAEAAALAIGSATMSQFFAMQAGIVEWLVAQGVDADAATSYVTSLLHGLSLESLDVSATSIRDLVEEHETPGGLNEHVRMSMESIGAFRALSAALDDLTKR